MLSSINLGPMALDRPALHGTHIHAHWWRLRLLDALWIYLNGEHRTTCSPDHRVLGTISRHGTVTLRLKNRIDQGLRVHHCRIPTILRTRAHLLEKRILAATNLSSNLDKPHLLRHISRPWQHHLQGHNKALRRNPLRRELWRKLDLLSP
jgi:hypothetical protein